MARFTLLHVLILLISAVTAHRQAHQHTRHRRQNSTAPFPVAGNHTDACYYWLEDIKHQGLAPLAENGYQVFRNVKDYGVKGDGVTDDTDAINLAISDGGRCAPAICQGTTITPAIVYFPPGIYKISKPIIQYYYTQLIGNPNCLPVIKATSTFEGIALIDSNPYGANGLGYVATNVFWRQVRNFHLDQTDIPIEKTIWGVHWPTGQATSLQNLVFNMSSAPGTQHQGLFIESGSGGFMTDLVFYGGLYGANIGNQQFTMRNFTFYNAVSAVYQLYNWGWTYSGFKIFNCSVGFNLTSGGPNAQNVGSVTLFDSEITDTPIGVLSSFTDPYSKFSNGSLIIENVKLNNVPVAVQGPSRVYLEGSNGSTTIEAWGQGHSYSPFGPNAQQAPLQPNYRPAGLLSDGNFYQRSKPQYEQFSATQFLSARDQGATGDGVTDDTVALQKAIDAAKTQKKFLFIDAGSYRVSSTIYIPAGSVIVGETYPVILGYGRYFSDVAHPKPVVQIGKSGEKGSIEWSDCIVSTQGATAGAILFEYNLASAGPDAQILTKRQDGNSWHGASNGVKPRKVCKPKATTTGTRSSQASSDKHWTPWASGYPGASGKPSGTGGGSGPKPTGTSPSTPSPPSPSPSPYEPTGPSGMWDVHARVGGFAGSELTLAECPTTPTVFSPDPEPINEACIAAFLTFHITSSAANAYFENVWIWVADHDIEDFQLRQITIYAGRGLLVESTEPIWLWGGAVEHHTLYQYQFNQAGQVYMGQIQTETPYYQPNPPVLFPFATNTEYADPDFSSTCFNTTGFNFTSSPDFRNHCSAWGVRIVDSVDLLIYGAGLYSFFANYNTTCSNAPGSSDPDAPYGCQTSIFSIEGQAIRIRNIAVYNLNTVGVTSLVDVNGVSRANYQDNRNVYPNGLAVFRL